MDMNTAHVNIIKICEGAMEFGPEIADEINEITEYILLSASKKIPYYRK
jgi:hypothetical protein